MTNSKQTLVARLRRWAGVDPMEIAHLTIEAARRIAELEARLRSRQAELDRLVGELARTRAEAQASAGKWAPTPAEAQASADRALAACDRLIAGSRNNPRTDDGGPAKILILPRKG